ncbi:MAG: sugar ABC transporter substrate-binding protein [Chloroflexi bacterium]|nr:sugar ABC transporter substrate-binding protein [Chloroflexota bacterium]
MRRMNWLVGVVVPALLATGCGSSAPPSGSSPVASASPDASASGPAPSASISAEPVSIRFAVLPDPGEEKNATKFVEGFTRDHPNVSVAVEPQAGDDYFQKLTLQAASNTLPDVYWIHDEGIEGFAQKGLALDLAQCNIDTSDFYPSMLARGQFEGRLFMVPRDYNHLVTMYNVDMFNKAGVSLPKDGWTWDEMVAAARKLTVKDAKGKTTQYGIEGDNFSWWAMAPIAVRGFGGEIINDAGGVAVDSDAAANGISALYQLVKDGIATNEFESPTEYLENGQAAMYFHVRPIVGPTHETIAAKFKWDFATFPKFPIRHIVGSGTSGYAISATTKHPQEACQLLAFIGSVEGQKIFSSTGNAVPVLKSLANDPAWRAVPDPSMNQDAFVKFPEADSTDEDRMSVGVREQAQTGLTELLEKVMLGQITPREMVTQWAERIRQAIVDAA